MQEARSTLLDSSAPESTVVAASATAGLPSVVRNKPSALRWTVSAGGLTNLTRPTFATVYGDWPSGTIEMVPSPPTLTDVWGGTLIGPLSPNTGRPVAVRNCPAGSTGNC